MTGHEIRAERLARGLTQADLAHMLGVNVSQIGSWERDAVTPKARNLARLQTLFAAVPLNPPMPPRELQAILDRNGWKVRDIARALGVKGMAGHWRTGRHTIPAAARVVIRTADGHRDADLVLAVLGAAYMARDHFKGHIADNLEVIAHQI